MELDRIYGHREPVSLYGLAAVMLLAGASKFIMPELWTGYEPRWLLEVLPVSSDVFIYATASFEAFLGVSLALRYRVRTVASIATLWLLGITITVASMGLWTIALRDFGLAVLAYTIAAREHG